jgi:hypothetical protein
MTKKLDILAAKTLKLVKKYEKDRISAISYLKDELGLDTMTAFQIARQPVLNKEAIRKILLDRPRYK